jgi:hypothetical protein
MSGVAKLQDIIDAISLQMDEVFQYLNRETGEVVGVTSEELEAAEKEEMEGYPAWQQANIELAQQIINDSEGKFVELPSRYEINEYEIMESFCYGVRDRRISEELAYTIKGRGAFRRFKDRVHQYGLAEEWYKYRDEAFREIAKAWCERHQIGYE